MAPTKKREKDNADNVGAVGNNNINGLTSGSGQGGDATTNEALAASASVAASSTTITPDAHTKQNGHQQEQELFLQAFESKL